MKHERSSVWLHRKVNTLMRISEPPLDKIGMYVEYVPKTSSQEIDMTNITETDPPPAVDTPPHDPFGDEREQLRNMGSFGWGILHYVERLEAQVQELQLELETMQALKEDAEERLAYPLAEGI